MVHFLNNCGFSHSCIIEEDGLLAVVDVGSFGTAGDIERFVTGNLNSSLDKIVSILVTHFHIDHLGGVGRLLKKLPRRTKVFFHPLVKEYLTGTRAIPRMTNWFDCLWPAAVFSAGCLRRPTHLLFETFAGIPLPLVRRLAFLPYGEERIGFFDFSVSPAPLPGLAGWQVRETPGHTGDSCSFFNKTTGEFICGDLFVNFPVSRPRLNPFGQDRRRAIMTLRNLRKEIAPLTIYPAHGRIIRDSGNALEAVSED